MKPEVNFELRRNQLFFIFHSSFFIEFCEAKFLWASPRFAGSGYPLHHLRRRCASATVVPLLSLSQKTHFVGRDAINRVSTLNVLYRGAIYRLSYRFIERQNRNF
jgi:hypothetical protein